MTQEIVQYVEAFGVNYPEYRTVPEECNEYRLTVEITKQLPAESDYSYKEPDFVWGDLVVKHEQREYCLTHKLDPEENLDLFMVRGEKTAIIHSVWIIRYSEDFPRLITCYVL